MSKKFLILLSLIPFQLMFVQKSLLKNFLEGHIPKEIGKRIVYRFLTEERTLHVGKWIGYPETFYWSGALRYADGAKDKELIQRLQGEFDFLFIEEKISQPTMNRVGLNMFGGLPLEFYLVTKDLKYRYLGLPCADSQWELPRNAKPYEKEWAEKGYLWQTRLWIDDMYMITIIQARAYKVTKDKKYIDHAAKEMVMYLGELQRPNDLFYHVSDVPYHWRRGNGWMAAGMAELLQYLPKKHKDRARIMEGYFKMMESPKKYQNPEGLWNQLIDKSDCWTETSGPTMFTFAFIKGVQNGWLDAEAYAPATRKAWTALVSYLNEKNQVGSVCVGMNKKNSKQYYYDRPRRTGDSHGQGPYLWCAAAPMEK